MSNKQLTVLDAPAQSHLPPSERPVIVFNNLSDEQFSKALIAFAPEERTKPNLWKKPEYTAKLMKCAAYCESVPALRPNGSIFASKALENSFDGAVIEKFKASDEEDFFFSVSEWYNDTIGEIPTALRDWDPYDDLALMPQYETGVDWLATLTNMDLKFNGFLDLLSNFIDLDEQLEAEVNKRKHGANTRFGSGGIAPTTKMPASVNMAANFSQFTPSALVSQKSWMGQK